MSKFNIVRVTELPSTITPSTMYILKRPGSEIAEVHFTNNNGTTLVPGISEQFVEQKVASLIGSGMGSIDIVDNIDERNRLNKPGNMLVMVLDASGDEFGSSGTALYLYRVNNNSYYRISVFNEDGAAIGAGGTVNVLWNSILGKPNSTPEQIDQAVNMAHEHVNKSVLDRIGISESGVLTVDNKEFANTILLPGDW